MQINTNSTGFEVGLCVAADAAARDHCVVAIKGTFRIDARGDAHRGEIQRPLIYSDEHYGDPTTTSTRHECDFALRKPYTDVLLHGHALSVRPVTRMVVHLELAGCRKELLVTGDRRWKRGPAGLLASAAEPFTRMPLVFERAFGGTDSSHPSAAHHGSELRNPVGTGFRANPRAQDAIDVPLPNIEDPGAVLTTWNERPSPIGCGVVGRGWSPRVGHAGTYDQRWIVEAAPFLPADFDLRYFQAAPPDQQIPHLRGGEVFKVVGVTEEDSWNGTIPHILLGVRFRFRDRDVEATPVLDTVLLDGDTREVALVWRASCPIGKRLTDLREVEVRGAGDERSPSKPLRMTRGKPHFRGLAACLAWLRQERRS